jgi:UbiA prenyltransferase family
MNWRVYARLGRVSNLPTVWTNALAGVILAGGHPEPARFGVLLLALSLLYVGGMFLNDAFDRRIDALERPERPIPSGEIRAQEVFAIGFGMLGAAVLVLAALAFVGREPGRWAPPVAGLTLAAVITYYDVWHKRDPLSPVVMGLCRVLVYVTAAFTVSDRLPAPVIGGALVLLGYLIGLTYVARQETLSALAGLWPLLFLGAPFVYVLPALGTNVVAWLLYAMLLAWVAYAISLLVRRRANIPRAVVSFLAGICLLDALLIAASGTVTFALIAAGGFVVTRYLQGHVPAT